MASPPFDLPGLIHPVEPTMFFRDYYRVAVNMYLAPRHSVSLKPQYDTHDIFVLQTGGTKHWKVHERPQPTPLMSGEQALVGE